MTFRAFQASPCRPAGPSTSTLDRRQGLRGTCLVLVIIALTALLYYPSLGHSFQYDDARKIVNNPHIGDAWHYVSSFWQSGYSEDTTRLLPNLSFVLTYLLFGLNPTAFNIGNLLIHLCNVWLVFSMAKVLLGCGDAVARGTSIIAAALFAFHPLNSEAVLYCNARPNTMLTLFFLLAFRCVLLIAQDGGTRRRLLLLGLSMVAMFMCKEIALVFLLCALPLFNTVLPWKKLIESRRRVLTLVFTWAFVLGVSIQFLTGSASGVESQLVADRPQGVSTYVLSKLTTVACECEVAGRYFIMALLPAPQLHSVHHCGIGFQNVVMKYSGDTWYVSFGDVIVPIAATLAVGICLYMCVLHRSTHRVLAMSVFGALACLLPTMVFPRNEYMVEYRTYLSMTWVCIGLGWLLATLIKRVLPVSKTAGHVLILSLGVALTLSTYVRARVWESPITLWRDAVDKAPMCPRAQYNYGSALLHNGRAYEALKYLQHAYAVSPQMVDLERHCGLALLAVGRNEEAWVVLRRALKRNPQLREVWYILGQIAVREGNAEEAVGMLIRARELGLGSANMDQQIEELLSNIDY